MKTLKFEGRDEWLYARRGKITGSTLKDVVSIGGITKEMICDYLDQKKVEYKKAAKKDELEALMPLEAIAKLRSALPKKLGYYDLIAAKLGLPPDSTETAMERGTRLEKDAVQRFREETGKEVDDSLIIWTRDDNENIAVSPDGVIGETEAVEAKCLSSARHIEAYLTQQIPEDYYYQVLQYFIVNEKLETLHFIFFDPRFQMFSDPIGKQAKLDYFEISVTRDGVQEELDGMLAYEREIMTDVDRIVNKLTF